MEFNGNVMNLMTVPVDFQRTNYPKAQVIRTVRRTMRIFRDELSIVCRVAPISQFISPLQLTMSRPVNEPFIERGRISVGNYASTQVRCGSSMFACVYVCGCRFVCGSLRAAPLNHVLLRRSELGPSNKP